MLEYSDNILESLFDELFPIARSITGPGFRKSLDIFARYLPLKREQVPTGARVFDWIIPNEWHIRSARLTDPKGKIIVDFSDSNLHVVNYSKPVDLRLSFEQLRPHIHTLPHLPDAIPYVTSYYSENWGFCLSHNQLCKLDNSGYYHAFIDSELIDGAVEFGHCKLPGETDREVLLTSYLCHPSLANNELSGPLVLLALYYRIQAWPRRRFNYRFLLNPETIGALCFLSRYQHHLRKTLAYGLILTCLGGDSDGLSYKRSRRGTGLLDDLVSWLDRHGETGPHPLPFTPHGGSDERQYCAPGFNFPVGNISRTRYGQYPGYHNSLDDKAFMGFDSLIRSIDEIEKLLWKAEIAGHFINLKPFGEPQLVRYHLYPSLNAESTRHCSNDERTDNRVFLNLVLQILSMTDGQHSMMDIADGLDVSLEVLREAIESLEQAGLIRLANHHEIGAPLWA